MTMNCSSVLITKHYELLPLVAPLIQRQNTYTRDAVTPSEKLYCALRFFATCQTFEEFKVAKAASAQSFGYAIMETCDAIISVLKDVD